MNVITEIVKAWSKFTRPIFYVSSESKVEGELKLGECIAVNDMRSVEILSIDYSKWIEYLASEEWRSK